MTRATEALLDGRLWDSIVLYPALLPTVGMFVYLGLHLRFRFRQGLKVLVVWFCTCLALMLGAYITRFIIGQPL